MALDDSTHDPNLSFHLCSHRFFFFFFEKHERASFGILTWLFGVCFTKVLNVEMIIILIYLNIMPVTFISRSWVFYEHAHSFAFISCELQTSKEKEE